MIKKNQPPGSLASRMRAVVQAAPPSARARAQTPRAGQRKDVFKRGVLSLETGQRIEVAIRSLSETGARVEFHAGGGAITGRVTLTEPSLGLKKRARVIWKDQNAAGLAFDRG